jgi:hypothetical protein
MPESRAFLYVNLRVTSRFFPIQVALTEIPKWEMLQFQSPPINFQISRYTVTPCSTTGTLWREILISGAFLYT